MIVSGVTALSQNIVQSRVVLQLLFPGAVFLTAGLSDKGSHHYGDALRCAALHL